MKEGIKLSKVLLKEQAKRKGMTHKELAAKGGRNSKGKPRLSISPRTKCSLKCPMWNKCSVKELSHIGAIKDPVTKKTINFKGKCALASASDEMKKRMKQLFSGKREDLDKLLTEFYADMFLQVHRRRTSLKEKSSTFKLGLDLRRTIHGEKRILEGSVGIDQTISPETLTSLYEQIKDDSKQSKEGKSKKTKKTKK